MRGDREREASKENNLWGCRRTLYVTVRGHFYCIVGVRKFTFSHIHFQFYSTLLFHRLCIYDYSSFLIKEDSIVGVVRKVKAQQHILLSAHNVRHCVPSQGISALFLLQNPVK